MNERIKELLFESGFPKFYATVDSEELEKFAELIVRECADWIDSNVGMIDEEARRDLLKHFGIQDEIRN